MRCKRHSYWPYLRGTHPKSPGKQSPVFQLSRLVFLSQTLLRLPDPTGQRPMLSQDTSFQQFVKRMSYVQGIMPYWWESAGMRSSIGAMRTWRRYWGSPRTSYPQRMPTRWNGSWGWGRFCQWYHTPSMVQSLGCRNLGIPSSCTMTLISLSYLNIVMDMERHFTSEIPSTAIREASSRSVIIISVMGL